MSFECDGSSCGPRSWEIVKYKLQGKEYTTTDNAIASRFRSLDALKHKLDAILSHDKVQVSEATTRSKDAAGNPPAATRSHRLAANPAANSYGETKRSASILIDTDDEDSPAPRKKPKTHRNSDHSDSISEDEVLCIRSG